MFANIATFISALATFAAVAPSVQAAPSTGLAGRNVHRAVPAQFQPKREYLQDSDLLEPYADYNERYTLFGCASKHNTTFWTSCCHPLLKDQTEDELPDTCFEDIPCDGTTTTVLPTTSVNHVASTSVAVTTSDAPVTTHKAATTTEKPETTTTEAPKTTSTHKTSSAEPTTSATSSGGSWVTGGYATYFYQEGNAGACGTKHSDSDLIVAIDIAKYGNLNAVSKTCGEKVRIVNTANGNSVVATVADVCPTCKNSASLDMSLGTFKALEADLSVGMFEIKYQVV